MTVEPQFESWFKQATGHEPYPFQVRFACDPMLLLQPSPLEGEGQGEGTGSGSFSSEKMCLTPFLRPGHGEGEGEGLLVDVPTGMGKTAMVVLGWLWRRRFAEEKVRKATPRRLVYCLPMRVLVEQTSGEANKWIAELGEHYPKEMTQPPNIHILMGGEDEEDWDMYPEHDQIIVGTQDMMLSRALNRGYAATRSRWPMKFGLLNMDCLWVFDEIQLMRAGLATTAQLDAFRRLLPNKDADEAKNCHGCRSVWMSATLQRDWLKTVDFKDHADGLAQLELDQDDHHNAEVQKRWTAKKPLTKAEATMGNALGLAEEVRKTHKPSTRTIVIVNTVKRACSLFEALKRVGAKLPSGSEPNVVLLHSRFRPEDRRKQVDAALAEIKSGEPGTIVVSTQVIEAGVDVSATTLFTELAPWASLVQRFGRCNRRGQNNDHAVVHWIAMPAKGADTDRLAAPYDLDDIETAAKQLEQLTDVGLRSLPDLPLPFVHTHVIRRKELIDLFDTTTDLAGNDIDIDRFVRDVEDSDVRVFWRNYGHTPNETDGKEAESMPRREELCAASVGEFREFAKKRAGKVWRWSFLDKKWVRAGTSRIAPGQVFLARTDVGGYMTERGWEPGSKAPVSPINPPAGTKVDAPDAIEDERLSRIGVWQTIAVHTDKVCKKLEAILTALPSVNGDANALRSAARWHDRGKAHDIFRTALPDGAPDAEQIWAKAAGAWKRYERRHFRHELASALSALDPRSEKIPDALRDLVAYLVAAHHGKVRLSIRSLPNELRPHGNRRFARGVWDDDELPATDLGGGVTAPAVRLSLEPMELGLCEQEPFRGLPSWAERMIGLRDTIGPFHLAYLEAILRAADMRASREAEQRESEKQGTGVADARREGV